MNLQQSTCLELSTFPSWAISRETFFLGHLEPQPFRAELLSGAPPTHLWGPLCVGGKDGALSDTLKKIREESLKGFAFGICRPRMKPS